MVSCTDQTVVYRMNEYEAHHHLIGRICSRSIFGAEIEIRVFSNTVIIPLTLGMVNDKIDIDKCKCSYCHLSLKFR